MALCTGRILFKDNTFCNGQLQIRAEQLIGLHTNAMLNDDLVDACIGLLQIENNNGFAAQ